jgi:catechol 2,3-dioxygenase-like lactoylglutathione lyase family enzyme
VIGALAGVTIATPDLDSAIAAYAEYLGYAGEVETVDTELATRLGALGVIGNHMATLFPESGENCFIRLVEVAAAPDYRPLTTYGWIVQDLDALAARLEGSPFKIIGPPATLDFDFTDKIRAMQVVGPSGEVLYLTEVTGPVPGFDLPEPKSFVGRIFVAILGVADLDVWSTAATAALGLSAGPRFAARIEVLSDALGCPREQRHALTTVALDAATLIEIDAFPATATRRIAGPDGLLPGIAMTSFFSTDRAEKALTPGDARSVLLDSALFELIGAETEKSNKN